MRTKAATRPDALDLADRLLGALHGLGRLYSWRNPLSAEVPVELTPPQIHTLIAIGSRGAPSMGELCRWLGATGPTVTGIVDRLERIDLVQRTRDGADRRVVRLELTRPGRAVHAQLRTSMRRRVDNLLSLLDAPDRADLTLLLEKLAARADERDAEAPPPRRRPATAARQAGRPRAGG